MAVPRGIGSNGIPLYIPRFYTATEKSLLLAAFGIESPELLYLSDSSDAAILKYDLAKKKCRTCYVDTYRVGYQSMRWLGETWTSFQARIRRMPEKEFGRSAQIIDSSLSDLDPTAEPIFRDLLDSAKRAGFRVKVIETYRTAEREALLFAHENGKTHTATSMHAYGRAIDVSVDDGNLRHASTRADWILFRQFVTTQANGTLRLIGTPDATWDWSHIELSDGTIGFKSVDEALAFAHRCVDESVPSQGPAGHRPAAVVRSSDACAILPHRPDGVVQGRSQR